MVESKLKGSTAVVVLGMHRSGTSIIGSALQVLGVDLGDNLMPPGEDNPKGYFEDQDIYLFHEELLAKIGCIWHSVLVDELPKPLFESSVEELCVLLSDKFDGQPLWSFKDPRTVRFIGLWEEVFDQLGVNVQYILAVRHPLSIASSLKKRDGFTFSRGLALTLLHHLEGLEVILKHGGLVVDYDKMMEEPVGQTERMGRFLNIDLSLRKEKIEKYAADFLDHGLRHNKYSSRGTSHGYELEGKCLELFELLDQFSALDSPDEGLIEGAGSSIAGIREYLNSQTVMLDAMTGQSAVEKRCDELRDYIHKLERNVEDVLEVERQKIRRMQWRYFSKANKKIRKILGRKP